MKCIVGLGLCLSLMSWNASVAVAGPCNAKTLKGSFGTVSSGTFTAPDGTRFPEGEVGLFTLDGVNNVSGGDTISFDGNVFTRTITGTYAVNADCSTTFVLTDNSGGVGTSSGVIVDNGDSVLLISASPGDTLSGKATRIK